MKQQPDLLFRGRRKFLWLIFATSCLFLPTLAFAPRLRPGTRGTSSSVLAGSKRSGSKAKEKGGKWERRRSTSSTRQSQVERYSPRPSPIINTYDDSRNIQTNLKRLRNPISCDHFGSCPGCVVDDHVGEIEIIRSAKRYFSSTYIRKNRMDVQLSGEDAVIEHEDDSFYDVVVPSDITQWRTQAKLVVAPKSSSWAKDGCVFGLYKRSSHDIIEIPNCQVHHPSINQAVRALEMATNKVGTPAFSEGSREGGLRYVQLQVERITGKISLTLVWASSDLKYTQPSLSRLTKDLNRLEPELWHSMWCHCNDGPGNNIFTRNPGNWYRLSGNEFLREPIAVGDHGWLYFSPLTFRQGNMDGFDILANDVARAIPGGSKVCELYAGVGLLGLTALVHHSGENPLTWVRCSDENPANLRSFKRSINSL